MRRKEQNEDGFEGKGERARGRRCRRSSAALRTAQSRLRSSALPCCPVLDRVRRRATVPRPLCCPEVKRGNSAVGSSRTRGQRPRTGCSNQRSHRDARSYAGSGQLERVSLKQRFSALFFPPLRFLDSHCMTCHLEHGNGRPQLAFDNRARCGGIVRTSLRHLLSVPSSLSGIEDSPTQNEHPLSMVSVCVRGADDRGFKNVRTSCLDLSHGLSWHWRGYE